MKLLPLCALFAATMSAAAQQRASVTEMLQSLTSKQATTHTVTAFDPGMLQSANARFTHSKAVFNGITLENFSYPERSFFVPWRMAALSAAYDAAGYNHLVDRYIDDVHKIGMPRTTLIDLWLHYDGTNIDRVMIMLRAPQQMRLFELTGTLKPWDLVHLSGHFGIPAIDPRAVIVPPPMAPEVPPQQHLKGGRSTSIRLPASAAHRIPSSSPSYQP
jgi:hypothetical protein